MVGSRLPPGVQVARSMLVPEKPGAVAVTSTVGNSCWQTLLIRHPARIAEEQARQQHTEISPRGKGAAAAGPPSCRLGSARDGGCSGGTYRHAHRE